MSTDAPLGSTPDEPSDPPAEAELGDWDDLEIAEEWERLCSPATRRVLALALGALSAAASRDAALFGDQPFDTTAAGRGAGFLVRLPRCTDGLGSAFRSQFSPVAEGLLDDVLGGRVPLGRNPAEGLLMHLMIEEARAIHLRAVTDTVFRAQSGLTDDDLDDSGQFDWSALRELLFMEDDLLSIYGGIALNRASGPAPSLITTADAWAYHYGVLPFRDSSGSSPQERCAGTPVLLSLVEGDAWAALNERAGDRPRGPRADMLSPAGALLWAGVAEELADIGYHEALEWTDEPYVPLIPDDEDPEDILFMRLPRCADRQDQAFRLQVARAFADLAADVRAGALPVPRTHGEDLAITITCNRAAERAESAQCMAEDPFDAEESEEDWYGIPLSAFARLAPSEFDYSIMDETLTAAAEAYLLWGDETGYEHPAHEVNQKMSGEDLRPEKWFDTFANVHPRPAGRGYPERVWDRLPAAARDALQLQALQQEISDARRQDPGPQPDDLDRPARDCGCGSSCCPGPGPWHGLGSASAYEQRALGDVRARTPFIAAMRQRVLVELGRLLHKKSGHAQLLDTDEPFKTTGCLVLSDRPPVALEQLHRILPGVTAPGRRMRLGVCWAGPDGRHEEAQWYCVDVTGIEEHSAGPKDEPWLRVAADEVLQAGMALADIIAVRRADPTTPLSPLPA
ncbi:hypothetical protein OG413_44470 [Streptomyces sp. NBC_01433]|uniref:hypothetical protein n=1 Tax=Streptomyces sp. NBC_01433 TaxID=2903864 RepID=UPI0022585F77|nr:hypothetical protein [Streptomyces sp. NBC_01433]MCX4682240.1 hypothetical protein [Streptomyces sp. NBC_01433]